VGRTRARPHICSGFVGDSVAAVVELPVEPRLFEETAWPLFSICWYLTVAVRRKGFSPNSLAAIRVAARRIPLTTSLPVAAIVRKCDGWRYRHSLNDRGGAKLPQRPRRRQRLGPECDDSPQRKVAQRQRIRLRALSRPPSTPRSSTSPRHNRGTRRRVFGHPTSDKDGLAGPSTSQAPGLEHRPALCTPNQTARLHD